MAEPQSNARLRAEAGAPSSGVIHVRTRLTADFTVLSNALVQRRGSAVTVGVAAYIASLPDGSSVTISALCGHFSEGEILVSRALRELEEAGYLERRRERTPTGQVRTRTYFYDVPGGDGGDGPPRPPGPPRPERPDSPAGPDSPDSPAGPDSSGRSSGPPKASKPARSPGRAAAPVGAEPGPTPRPEAGSAPGPAEDPAPAPARSSASASAPALALADADPAAVAVLTGLRRVDPRLVLSEREAARLAPAVAEWLAAGVGPREITGLLTARLPDHFRVRPAGVLAYRLRETPLPAPPPPAPPRAERPPVLPFLNCDGCERAIRAAEPGYCSDCRRRRKSLPAAA